MGHSSYSRIVVGGGLFGAYSAIVLAREGHSVLLVERDSRLLNRASYANQARLHTGLHYPRSIVTAQEALNSYERFRACFPAAVRDFRQIYAVARHGSKTSPDEFERFIGRLGIASESVKPTRWFLPNKVDAAWIVEEPTFDVRILRRLLEANLKSSQRVTIALNTEVIAAQVRDSAVTLKLSSGSVVTSSGLVNCAYAGVNSLRAMLGLDTIPLSYELAEVLLGRVAQPFSDVGVTVMDGPFWSLMPFGQTSLSTLTSVGNTPLERSHAPSPTFSCQLVRRDCTPEKLCDCRTCDVAPTSQMLHHVQQMKHFVKPELIFAPRARLTTVKAILATTESDDARPTIVRKELDRIWTVFSGKVNSIMDLDEAFQ